MKVIGSILLTLLYVLLSINITKLVSTLYKYFVENNNKQAQSKPVSHNISFKSP